MIKLIYKICKNFTLHEENKQKIVIEDNEQLIKGSHFAIGDEYVDYAVSEEDTRITGITQTLLDQDYLKLERQVKM